MKRADFFSRHIVLKGFGEAAQSGLSQKTVAIVGMGGLGCPASLYLAAAGIGKLILIEGDRVEESNLHRQVLFDISDVGQFKCEAAGTKLKKSYPFSHIEINNTFLTSENAESLIRNVDLIVDGVDDQQTKFLIGDAGSRWRIPVLYGAVDGFDSQIALFENSQPEEQVGLRDLFSEEDESGLIQNCFANGVLGPVAGLTGIEMALEAIKFLTGVGENLSGKLKLIDAFSGERKTIRLGIKRAVKAEMYSGNYAFEKKIKPENLEEVIKSKNCLLVDVRTSKEFGRYNIGGVNIPIDELKKRTAVFSGYDFCILLCEKGNRSKLAALILENMGFNNFYILEGGLRSLH